MSKERARRRAERLVVAERVKAKRARRVSRRLRRQELLRGLTPRRRRTGRLSMRSRGERLGIVVLPLVAVGAVWWLVPELGLRIVLIAMLILVLPAVVVVVLGRRS